VAGAVGEGTPPTGEGGGVDGVVETVFGVLVVVVGAAGGMASDGVGLVTVGGAGVEVAGGVTGPVVVGSLRPPGLARGRFNTLLPTGGMVGGIVGSTLGLGVVLGGRFGPFLTRSRRASTW
jgi:hypothetical protein